MKNYIIACAIALALGIGGGMLVYWQFLTTPAKPDIGEPGTPIHGEYPVNREKTSQIIYTDKNLVPYGGFIIIEPTLNAVRDTLHIHAYDNLKFTDQDWPIKCSAAPITFKKHIIGIDFYALVGYNQSIKTMEFLYGGGLHYTRMFAGTFGVGCGVMVIRGLVSKDMYYGVQAHMLVQFGQ